MQVQILISIVAYMILMLLIGYWAYRRTTDLSDYMLGGRGLGPGVTALSAGASDMSGWMLMGLPGAMYATGLSSAWIAIGLLIGAYANYLVVAPRLRTYTEVANDSITIPDFLENRFKDKTKVLRFASAMVILVFFTLYTTAGMVSGGRLFESSFHLDYRIGLFVTAGVVVAYTLFGGFLAVSWTDFVQGCIMFIALVLVPIVALTDVGGFQATFNEIRSIDPSLLDLFKGTSVLGIISFLAWGLGYFGQPHIIVRFMAITSVNDLKPARRIGISWMAVSIIGAMFTGLVGIAYYSKNAATLTDPETVFIQFSNILFHPLITGFLLAAILAAIMSTISSQLLVTSSAVTEDFYKSFFRRNATDKELVFIGRASVLVIALIAITLAFNASETILGLVGYAWAGFGSAFGPAILLSLYWKRMTKWGALAGMLVGAVTVIFWVQSGLTDKVYEMIPGFFASLASVILVSLATKEPVASVRNTFEEMEETIIEETKNNVARA
ncbi:sodium/proline symporter PutP [Aneurinibacillus migulanus]|uniref:Sodium/proline symporter n=1 Tax=Aneurinibacillus migulanus TaxID=47500 RepID=A0A0D1XWZ7_ANEMI|nr:sodium/proline symporter PutP [Aneurinibacillus migulanus]KIV58731.1 proline:sodium symporter PutP [Aneurinibacillus migulanus]KON96422.1 proline:sodium symporter PutP [Aneurinibacillus migulanus]MED0892364.1 sodium/proline symporter PutP [Aneurinibacillus migulanus]MED1615684.1 sodium/proline symporter PutP [Aneurinibacillus migulanus]SDI21252.1 solute:Na+ symporter, SSS family [Aneurinibacillus migulanus]